MVNFNWSFAQFHSVEIVHCKYSAALILVTDEAKALALARVLLAHQIDVANLAPLRENGDQVALAQIVGQIAGIDPGAVLVLLMPAVFRRHMLLELF